MSAEKHQIIDWFKKSLNTENCTVELQGVPESGNGYVADIFFAKVTLNNNKEVNLVAKVSRNNESRDFMEDFCKREVIFYRDVLPIFQQFQNDKNVKEPFEAVPKCYKTITTENAEIIIQENMKARGYELHEKSIPMNLNHIKLALKNYAKFHAISFAINDQKPEVFKNIEKQCYNLFKEKMNFFAKPYREGVIKLIANLKEAGREDLAERYKKLVNKDVTGIIEDLLDDVPKEKVLTHADCHNGNFMFEYQDGTQLNPVNMVFLDFQLSFVFSPMFDLGLYLYCGASKTEFSHFTELMEFYHKELSSFLSQLGSDVDKLFPISTMWQHWKKYSFYGFHGASMFLEVFFIDSENAPVIEGGDDTFGQFLNVKVNDRAAFLERLVAIVEHYLDFNNIN